MPPPAKTALNILFVSAVLFLISTLPTFSPENILTLTSSRLQTPNDVLFTRLASLRPNGTLTADDELLKPRIASIDARCLYLTYGPDTVTHCPFCTSDEPTSYLYYSLPLLALPHLLHLCILGLATSNGIAGKHGNRWRTCAAVCGSALAAIDIYLFATRDWKANARVFRPEDLTHFFWRMRTVRGVAVAGADCLLAALLYLSATNRMFATSVTNAERVETVLRTMEQSRGKLSALGIMKNVIVRDEGLSAQGREYWKREKLVMGEVMDEREVVEGVRDALEKGRVSVQRVEDEARKYADGIVVQSAPETVPAQDLH